MGRPAPLRLRWGNGLGIVGPAIGAPFLLIGGALFVSSVRDVSARGWSAVPLLGWPIMLGFLGAGALLAVGTGGVTIDGDRRNVISWVGLLFVPIVRERTALDERARAAVSPHVRPNGSTRGFSLGIVLGDGREIALSTFEARLEAEGLRLRIAAHLGVAGERGFATPEVTSLPCPSCGAPVAPGDADRATCAHCGASVELPGAVRSLRETTLAEAAERARVEAIVAAIGERPGVLEGVLAQAPALLLVPLLPATLFFYGLVLGSLVADVTTAAAPFLGADLLDTGFALPIAFALAAIPAAVSLRSALHVREARALEEVRLRAGAMLLARPPEHEGGASACRGCGAPLEVPRAAPHVRCAFCGTHNLVDPPLALRVAMRDFARIEQGDLGDAERELAKARQAARATRRGPIAVATIFVMVATFLLWMMMQPPEHFAARAGTSPYAEAFPSTCPDLRYAKRTPVPFPNAYKWSTCQHRVPLRKGQVATLRVEGNDAPLTVRFRHRSQWLVPTWEERDGARVARLTTPFDAWYSMEMEVEKGRSAQYFVTWRVETK